MSNLRLALAGMLALSLAACGGSGTTLGGLLGTNLPQCDTGTRVQLASPQNGQTGVSTGIGQIVVVADGNTNTLYNMYGEWNVVLTPAFGGASQFFSQPLSLVADPNGPHPYPSDFYYSAPVQGLTPGMTWNATLQQSNGNTCTGVPLGAFST